MLDFLVVTYMLSQRKVSESHVPRQLDRMEITPADVTAFASRPATARSAVSNRRRLFEGMDGRRSSARRFRDLIADYAREVFGRENNLTIAEVGLLRQAAALTIQAELLQAAVVRGQAVNADELIRTSSEVRRVLAALRRQHSHKSAPAGPSLSQYLASLDSAPPVEPDALPSRETASLANESPEGGQERVKEPALPAEAISEPSPAETAALAHPGDDEAPA
jgi:hypothetical protein